MEAVPIPVVVVHPEVVAVAAAVPPDTAPMIVPPATARAHARLAEATELPTVTIRVVIWYVLIAVPTVANVPFVMAQVKNMA